MIRIDDLEFRYGDGGFRLLIDELEIEPGTTAAFIGPSGSGKTTLLNLIAGVLRPERGRVTVGDTGVSELGDSERRDFRVRHIGMVFQEFELLDYLDVRDNILLPYRINRSLRLDADVKARAEELAEQVGIADKLGRHPGQLSQGERQRAAVCRAVVTRPELMLADEPTGNLDPDNTARVLDILFEYAGRNKATFLTVTHDHGLLDRFGRIVDFNAFRSRVDDPTPGAGQPGRRESG